MLIELTEKLGRRWLNNRGIQSRWAQTSGGRIHFFDAPGHGELPPVVLFHGISTTATSFGFLMEALRRDFSRVLAFDTPGHGLSEVPRFATLDTLYEHLTQALKPELGTGAAVIFGNSLGGAFAVKWALEHPGLTRGLILVSPAGAPMSPSEMANFFKIFPRHSPAQAREFLRRLYHRAPWYTPLIAPGVHRLFARPLITDILESAKPDRHFTPEELGSFTMPVMLIWGRSDRVMPPNHAGYFKRHLPEGSVIEEPEGFGHCPHLDNPLRLARLITIFARERALNATQGNRS
ncbi:MAG: alpha/beta fold hydrolase [Elusimicrobia bacterium]|nr:alpha/beta fold hydrolase [Elusimicrobiota bacterium]